MTPEQLTRLLHQHIPLTAAMQVQVRFCEPERMVIAAPLAPNLNIHGTAFGGSLAILGILSGWTLLYHALQARGLAAKLVIQKNECEYLEPVAQEFTAESQRPAAEEWEAFCESLVKRGRARMTVASTVFADGRAAVKSSGTFVAIL